MIPFFQVNKNGRVEDVVSYAIGNNIEREFIY